MNDRATNRKQPKVFGCSWLKHVSPILELFVDVILRRREKRMHFRHVLRHPLEHSLVCLDP